MDIKLLQNITKMIYIYCLKTRYQIYNFKYPMFYQPILTNFKEELMIPLNKVRKKQQ